MSKRVYSPSQREQARLKAEEIGPAAAGRELGIPAGSIAYWQNQARLKGSGATSQSMPKRRSRPATVSCSQSASPKAAGQMGSERKIAKSYTPSERARALELAAAQGVTAAASKLSISRFSIYNWQRRARLLASGKDTGSSAVGREEKHSTNRDERILLEWRAHPGLGPSQVRNQLRRQGLKVSLHTVRCVLDEHGYVTPKVRRQPVHDQRYEAVRPNHLWHMDFLHRHIHKQKVHVLLVIDDFSRFIVGATLWDGERVAIVQETFLGAVGRHGTGGIRVVGSPLDDWPAGLELQLREHGLTVDWLPPRIMKAIFYPLHTWNRRRRLHRARLLGYLAMENCHDSSDAVEAAREWERQVAQEILTELR